jgi:hypothetical protein
MLTETTNDGTRRTICDPEDRAKLLRVLERLGNHVKDVPPIGHWLEMSSEDLWWKLLQQVCVMGSARGIEGLSKDDFDALQYATSLRIWKRHGFDADYLENALLGLSATRFYHIATLKLAALARTPSVVRGNRVTLLDGFSESDEANFIRDELMARCDVFRLKSASDFMITVGLSHDVIALDQRIVGVLKKFLHYDLEFDKIQRNKPIYLSVETELRDVCRDAGTSLAVLDRALFQFTEMNVIQYLMESEFL